MVCITFLIVLLQILNLSIYPDSRNLIQVDLKHSKCNCELVLLQANIKSTWNLDRWCVFHYSLPYFRDTSWTYTKILGTRSKLIWNTKIQLSACATASKHQQHLKLGLMVCITFLTDLLQGQKLSIYLEPNFKLYGFPRNHLLTGFKVTRMKTLTSFNPSQFNSMFVQTNLLPKA